MLRLVRTRDVGDFAVGGYNFDVTTHSTLFGSSNLSVPFMLVLRSVVRWNSSRSGTKSEYPAQSVKTRMMFCPPCLILAPTRSSSSALDFK